MAKVVVIKAAGINADEEMVHAYRLSGADVELLHVSTLLRRERTLSEFDIFVVPGGFSYGDDLGAGTVLANQLRSHLQRDIDEFVDSGKLVMGICNGFQVLVRLGILPGWGSGSEWEKAASLIENVSGHYEDRWVRLQVETDRCAFLPSTDATGQPTVFRSPVAHAEGRFVVRDAGALARLREHGQIAVTYRRYEPAEDGSFPVADGVYPDNPNGSTLDIAGICNERGNVFGMMPHPERFVHGLQSPNWTRTGHSDESTDVRESGEGLLPFRCAVEHADSIRSGVGSVRSGS